MKYPFLENSISMIGRVCFSAIFVMAGFHKVAYYSDTLATMLQQNIPYSEILLIVSIVLELGGGLLVLLGWHTRFGALLLFLFIIPVTFYFHDFWTVEPADVANQVHHFMKNLAMMGGALYILAHGAGRYSIDGHRAKK